MPDYHAVIGFVALLLNLVAYGLYFRGVFKGFTKPHPFTWLVFSVVDGTVFFAQIVSGGGPGAWILGMAAVLNACVFLVALVWGEKRIPKTDWVCLVVALFGIALWRLTNDPFLAVVFASVADAVAKVPTMRKSYFRPHEETVSTWFLGALSYGISIAALTSLNPTTVFFPAEIVATNALVVGVVLLRRRQLAKISQS